MAEPDRIRRLMEQLISLFATAQEVIRRQIAEALASGQVGTPAFRRRRLAGVQGTLDELRRQAEPRAMQLVADSYAAGASFVPGRGTAEAGFGTGIDNEAIKVIANNMITNLHAAEDRVGRRVNDLFRRVGLHHAAMHLITGTAPSEGAQALAQDLEERGIKAFTDRLGREWDLRTYTEMVIRTTTREASTYGTRNAMLAQGLDLVRITSHPHPHDICSPYDGKTFSLTGATEGYPVLDKMPPFHPNCRHVMAAAPGAMDALEKKIEAANA